MKPLLAAALLAASLLPAALGAQQRDTTAGEHLFSANCAACHGSDGRGGERAPNIATLRSVISRTDDDLEAVVMKGLPGIGMPPFGYLGDQKVQDIVAYLRILQGKRATEKVEGDPKIGRALFYGKADCAKCHMVRGEGGFLAADLTSYGDSPSVAEVHRAIVDPNRNLEPTSKVVEVRTLTGERVSGLLRSENNFDLSLLTEDGRFHMYSKAKLASIRHTSHSIMPSDYESTLSGKEIEDLVSFLITTASTPHPAQHAEKKGDDDDN